MTPRPNLNELAKTIFEANKAKGFHDEQHSDEQLIMLIITEISEAEEAIKSNAEVLKMSTSIHPKGVDERRDVALVIFQIRQSENKVKDLSSLLQASHKMLKVLSSVLLSLKAHPDYVTGRSQEFIDQVSSIEEVINEANEK